MPLITFGINHKTAPIDIREKMAFSPETAPLMLRDLLQMGAANEGVILSTCNRTELYCNTENTNLLMDWFKQHPQTASCLKPEHWYFYQDDAAVRHVIRVASGLDSMALGEPQILGQMKDAFELAQQGGAVGSRLHRLFQTAFAVTKQVRNHTENGFGSVSLAYAAVDLAKRIFANLAQCRVLLIGAGQTIELAALHLANQGVKRIVVANRDLEKAEQLAVKFWGHGVALTEIFLHLQEADIVISATGSQLPILDKKNVARALKMRRRRRPLFMVDLAVPRDIEADVAKLEDVYLYNLDDLQKLIANNLKSREEAAKQAEAIIDIQTQHFMRELKALDAVNTICDYRDKVSNLCEQELAKALETLQKGELAEIVLKELTHKIAGKIMHLPTTQLRQAALDGRDDLLILARHLFDL